eukprot:4837785-Prymnesium_polylepis.1
MWAGPRVCARVARRAPVCGRSRLARRRAYRGAPPRSPPPTSTPAPRAFARSARLGSAEVWGAMGRWGERSKGRK